MKTEKTILLIAFFLHVLLAVLPFIPKVNSWLPNEPTPRESLRISLTYIGSHFTLLGAWLGMVLVLRGQHAKSLSDLVDQRLSGAIVGQRRDDEFYLEFLNHARSAKSYVLISYFAPQPPDLQSNESLSRYYVDIEGIMRSNSGTMFRRLIRKTPANERWAGNICRRLQGCSNVSVALVADRREHEMPLAMSVQVIDDRYVWLVAIESHARSGQYRDVFIDDPLLAKTMVKYNKRLWDIGTPLMNLGRLTEQGGIGEQMDQSATGSEP